MCSLNEFAAVEKLKQMADLDHALLCALSHFDGGRRKYIRQELVDRGDVRAVLLFDLLCERLPENRTLIRELHGEMLARLG